MTTQRLRMKEKSNNSLGLIGKFLSTLASPLFWVSASVIALSVVIVTLIKCGSESHAGIATDGETLMTPTRIRSIENIGEWEFLAISDEEMVDTVRYGIFGDDELVRIYYGTLRLGVDLREAKDGWIKTYDDSVSVTLPKIKLLDNDFIDETRTVSFFESGKWTNSDRRAMYERAYRLMMRRCLSESNLNSARQNAELQFGNLMRSIGFEKVGIDFEE